MTTIVNLVDRSYHYNVNDKIETIVSKQPMNMFHYYKDKKTGGSLLALKTKDKPDIIIENPSPVLLKKIWEFNNPNKDISKSISDNLKHVIEKFKIKQNIDYDKLNQTINKFKSMDMNSFIKENINKKSSEIAQKMIPKESSKKGGWVDSTRCMNLPLYTELPEFKNKSAWEKILLTLEYNDWFWDNVSCQIRPYICLLFPIFCIEEYIQDYADESIFWTIVKWVYSAALEILDLTLLIVGFLAEVLVAGVGNTVALATDTVQLIMAFLRFDISGFIFGLIGFIPYVGGLFRISSRALLYIAESINKLTSKFPKLSKLSGLVTIIKKLAGHIDKVSVFLKLLSFGEAIGKINKSTDYLKDILTPLIKNGDDIIEILVKIKKSTKILPELYKKFGVEKVDLILKLTKYIKYDDFIQVVKVLNSLPKDTVLENAIKLIAYGQKFGMQAKIMFKEAYSGLRKGLTVFKNLQEKARKSRDPKYNEQENKTPI